MGLKKQNREIENLKKHMASLRDEVQVRDIQIGYFKEHPFKLFLFKYFDKTIEGDEISEWMTKRQEAENEKAKKSLNDNSSN